MFRNPTLNARKRSKKSHIDCLKRFFIQSQSTTKIFNWLKRTEQPRSNEFLSATELNQYELHSNYLYAVFPFNDKFTKFLRQ